MSEQQTNPSSPNPTLPEIVDPAVVAHNAIMQLTSFYGAALEQKRREVELANAQVQVLKAQLARQASVHEQQLSEGRAVNKKLSDELTACQNQPTRAMPADARRA
jgi:hypothetical protein